MEVFVSDLTKHMLFVSLSQVIQMNKLPLILNFVGTTDCNTGHILSLEPLIEPLLGELKGAVIES